MKILIDVLGADKGVECLVEGTKLAMDRREFTPVFVGPENEIRKHLEGEKRSFEIIDASDMVTNHDKPTTAIRRKKDSSMVKAFRALKEGQADGMISTGSTGTLLAGATLIIGRINNVQRAAITLLAPGIKKSTVILDVGANMDASAEMLVQFAVMANSYARLVFNTQDPKVGLLNIGTEESKGNKLSVDTYKLLDESKLNFIGNVEPYDLLTTEAQILVTDGFAGNIALKTAEGVGKTFKILFKEALDESFLAKIGAGLMMPELKKIISRMDIDKIGAAPLLGSKKPVFKAHGSSTSKQFALGIIQLIEFIEAGVISQIEKDMED